MKTIIYQQLPEGKVRLYDHTRPTGKTSIFSMVDFMQVANKLIAEGFQFLERIKSGNQVAYRNAATGKVMVFNVNNKPDFSQLN